jgi:hypothetical protein
MLDDVSHLEQGAALTANDLLVELARVESFALQPQPIQSRHEQIKPLLVILVGDGEQIETLIIDWLAEAAAMLGIKPDEIDRDILACPKKSLAIPQFVVDGALDRRERLQIRPTPALVEMVLDGERLHLLHKEVFKNLISNLTGALQKAWDHLEHDVYPKPSRNQFRSALRGLLPTRTQLFGGPDPIVRGIIVLAWGETRPVRTGYMSPVAQRLQVCIKTVPSATSVAARWLERQAANRPGQRTRKETENEPEVTSRPEKKPGKVSKSKLLLTTDEHLGRVKAHYAKKERRVSTKLGKVERQLERSMRTETSPVPLTLSSSLPPTLRLVDKPKVVKLSEKARSLRTQKRSSRRRLNFLVVIERQRQRKARKEKKRA